MELRQLKYFVKAAETLNFSDASKALHITQSTLSQQIHQLEDELDAKLFERNSHSMRLTDLGEAFLPAARKTIIEANASIDRIRDIQQLNVGEISIGSTYTFCPLLKETVLEFIKRYPGVKLNIFCKNMEELMEMLIKQEIDVALSYKPDIMPANVESHILFDNQLSLVVNKNHPLAKYTKIKIADLDKCIFAMPGYGTQARSAIDKILLFPDFTLNVKLEINEINVLLDLVKNTNMVTMLSQATANGLPGLVAIPLDLPGCTMEGSFHLLKDVYRKRITKEFLKLICENRFFGISMMNIF